MVKRKTIETMKANEAAFQEVTGVIQYKLTNDYMFRAVLQENEEVLRGLVCSLLNIANEEIKTIDITNPIILGETINDKDVILDLAILLNCNQRLNIEMQVVNQNDWPERSIYYICTDFSSLNKGLPYSSVLPLIHVSILDFTLFPKQPMFYSCYRLIEEKIHHLYSSKIGINVLSLSCIELATDEDKACKLDYWAVSQQIIIPTYCNFTAD